MARVANPYSENEDSDNEDQDYTVVGPREGGEGPAVSEVDTLVPGAVQHVPRTGYPSNEGVKQSLDINEKPSHQKNRKLIKNNPKPTKAQLLVEPVTCRLYFKAAQGFKRDKTNNPESNTLYRLCVDVCTPRVRVLE